MGNVVHLTPKDAAEIPAHWREVNEDDEWAYEIKLDGDLAALGTIRGKGLTVVDQIVALLPDLLIERPHASSLEISMDCVPF